MVSQLGELYRARDLIMAWTGRSIQARYQQSVLGWLWAIVQPVAAVVILTVVFTQFVPIDTGDVPYPIFSYVAVVPWTFFASSLADITGSLVGNMGLLTKIYFPREVLPIAALLARLLDFGIAAALLVILMLIFRVQPFLIGWLFLPVILAVQILLILGLGLAAAAANVFTRDIDPLFRLVIQLWFYASPVIYPVSLVPEQLQPLYFLNPMAGILESYRDVLINGRLPGYYLWEAMLISLVTFVVGYWFFKRVEFQFADIV